MLEEYRKVINEIDDQLMELFEKRMKVVVDVAQYKQDNNLPIFHEQREKEVIEKNLRLIQTEQLKPYAHTLLTTLMDVSKEFQKQQINYPVKEATPRPVKAKYGLIGKTLHYSLSPQIHHSSFKMNHIRAEYTLYEVEESKAGQIVQALKTLGINGANVTMPYKQIVMEQLNEISDEARKIGAVNTITIKDGKAYGYNTDYAGILSMLRHGDIDIAGHDFYVLGAGGSARSVVWCLKDNGADKITLVSRNVDSAKKMMHDLPVDIIDYEAFNNVGSGYGIVNTTPCGMSPNIDDMAISEEKLRCFKAAIDLVYNPEETKFLRIAKLHGLKTTTGLHMLVAQAIRAQEIWYDIEIASKIEDRIYANISKYLIESNQSIYLIGFMGVGKTTVGKHLASILGVPFVDCDTYIESKYNMSISEIFERHGEGYFRTVEYEVLVELGRNSPSIIATGGGIVTCPQSYDFLKQHKCVYLKDCVDTLYDRVKDDTNRPLADAKESFEQRYNMRIPLYEALATQTIDRSCANVYETAYKILVEIGLI